MASPHIGNASVLDLYESSVGRAVMVGNEVPSGCCFFAAAAPAQSCWFSFHCLTHVMIPPNHHDTQRIEQLRQLLRCVLEQPAGVTAGQMQPYLPDSLIAIAIQVSTMRLCGTGPGASFACWPGYISRTSSHSSSAGPCNVS